MPASMGHNQSVSTRRALLPLLILVLFLLPSCSEEPEPPEPGYGHFEIIVSYPEVVRDDDGNFIGYKPSPAEGVTARVYRKDASCLGYKDAGFGIAYVGDESVQSLYTVDSDENGVIRIDYLPAREFYLTVFASKLRRYSEKIVTIPISDTLSLKKDFTNLANFFYELEPWDEPNPFPVD